MEELENWDFRVSLGYVFVTVAQKQKGKKKMKLYLVLCIETGCFHTFAWFYSGETDFSEVGNCSSVIAAVASSSPLPFLRTS